MSVEQQIEHNLRHNYIVNFLDGTAFWLGASFFATRTILPLFITNLTDSKLAIGILSAVVSTGWLLPQLFTANWVRRKPVKKVIVVNVGLFAERMPIISLVLAAWLASRWPTAALVFGLLCAAWFQIGAGVVAVGWQDMMAKLFPTKTRGRFMGATFFAGTLTGVIGAAIASWVLETYPFPTNFMISFGCGAVFIMISWFFLALTKEPPDTPTNAVSDKSVDWDMIGEITIKDHNFRKYIIAAIVTSFGLMAVGFLTVYALDRWQVSAVQVGQFTTAILIGQAIGYLGFGWLSDRKGHKLVLEIGTLIGVIALAVAIVAGSPQVFFLVFVLQGINNSAWTLSGINIIFEFCSPDLRPTYIGLSNTVTGIFSGLAPLLAGVLIDQVGYLWMFGTALVFGVLGYAVLRFAVAEPRFTANESPLSINTNSQNPLSY